MRFLFYNQSGDNYLLNVEQIDMVQPTGPGSCLLLHKSGIVSLSVSVETFMTLLKDGGSDIVDIRHCT